MMRTMYGWITLAILVMVLGLGACDVDADVDTDNDRNSALPESDTDEMAGGSDTQATGDDMTDEGAMNEASILGEIIAADSMEIAVARAAMGNLRNSDAKGFAQMMIDDHGKNLKQARDLAGKLNVTPTPPANADVMLQGALARVQGASDTVYMAMMVEDHTKTLARLDQMMNGTTNSELRSFLEATRTAVQMHLEGAREIQQSLGSGSSAGARLYSTRKRA